MDFLRERSSRVGRRQRCSKSRRCAEPYRGAARFLSFVGFVEQGDCPGSGSRDDPATGCHLRYPEVCHSGMLCRSYSGQIQKMLMYIYSRHIYFCLIFYNTVLSNRICLRRSRFASISHIFRTLRTHLRSYSTMS